MLSSFYCRTEYSRLLVFVLLCSIGQLQRTYLRLGTITPLLLLRAKNSFKEGLKPNSLVERRSFFPMS